MPRPAARSTPLPRSLRRSGNRCTDHRQRPGRRRCRAGARHGGVEHMVLTKYRWTANTPRAHITNQRTLEVFRELAIEEDRDLLVRLRLVRLRSKHPDDCMLRVLD